MIDHRENNGKLIKVRMDNGNVVRKIPRNLRQIK